MNETTGQRFTSQLPINIIANVVYFLINIVIGIFLVPYFISTLGVAAYGLIPLVTSITGYVAIVIQSLNTAVSRYLTVDLQRGDYGAANKTFNTAVFALTAIILLMVPIVIAVAYVIPGIFSVPAGQKSDAALLFLGVCASFLIRSWSGNFTVQLFACNRLDLQNLVNIINLIIQTGLIVVLFIFYGPNLAFIGAAYLVGAIVASVVAIILAKRVCPHLEISPKYFDRSQLKVLGGMSGWVVMNQIGSLLFLQIDIIVVNILFGAASAGEYAIALMWVVLLRGISDVFTAALTPMVFTYYAKGQIETLTKVMASAVKIMGIWIALPIGLICGFAPQILTLWVGSKFAFLAPLMILLTIHLVVNLAIIPLFSINVAYNKVRLPGILTLLMGVGNLSLAFALPILFGLGYYGVAAAGAIVLTLKNAVFTPWYAAKVMNVRTHVFLLSMLPGILITIGLIAVSLAIGYLIPIHSFISLILVGGTISVVYLFMVWKFMLSRFEIDLFRSYLPAPLRRFIA